MLKAPQMASVIELGLNINLLHEKQVPSPRYYFSSTNRDLPTHFLYAIEIIYFSNKGNLFFYFLLAKLPEA